MILYRTDYGLLFSYMLRMQSFLTNFEEIKI